VSDLDQELKGVGGAESLLEERPYRFDIAPPKLPGVGPRVIPGIDVATDAAPALRDSYALRGDAENEGLSSAVQLADFNGDGQSDLLVHGEEGSYVLLGPVELNGVTDVREEADLFIDADVGRAAARMGDIQGQGHLLALSVTRDVHIGVL